MPIDTMCAAYENVRQFWERRFGPSVPMSSEEREDEIQRLAQAINTISRSSVLEVPNQSASLPFIISGFDGLKEEIKALHRQLYRVERVCQEEKQLLQNVQQQSQIYYQMAYQASLNKQRQQATAKRLKKLLQLASYYLPADLQRHVNSVLDDSRDHRDDSQDWAAMLEGPIPLEYRVSNSNLTGPKPCQHDRPDCCALVVWKDYRDYWPVFCLQEPLGCRESRTSQTDEKHHESDCPHASQPNAGHTCRFQGWRMSDQPLDDIVLTGKSLIPYDLCCGSCSILCDQSPAKRQSEKLHPCLGDDQSCPDGYCGNQPEDTFRGLEKSFYSLGSMFCALANQWKNI